MVAHFHGEAISLSSNRNQILARKLVASLKIRYQPYGNFSFLAESFDLIICNPPYPPLISMSLNHNQLQKPIVTRLSLSAETEVYEISFLSTAPLLMLFLSLGCFFNNCRNQISAVFLYRPKPKSMYFLSFRLHHTSWRVFLLDVCFKIAKAKICGL